MNKLIKKQKKNNKGFSLVELIVVIAIMAVLVGVIAPQFLGYTDKAKKATDVQNAQQLAQEIAIEIAEADAVTEVTDAEVVTTDGTYNVQAVPVPKFESGEVFLYLVDASGNVEVGVGAVDGEANVTSYTQLYPVVSGDYSN